MNKLKASNLSAGLYIVATPIGNMGDITLRALDVLKNADLVACEDKRVTGKLLKFYDIANDGRLVIYNDHSKEGERRHIVSAITEGKVIALVSDAGMPLVSDPGYKLVRDCLDLGLAVTSVPGANAPLAAIQLSGLPSDKFMFCGFLPSKESARANELQAIQNIPATLVFYESANRLIASLQTILDVMGDRKVAVVREITKMYEESRRDHVTRLIEYYKDCGAPKGEIVVVVSGCEDRVYSQDELRTLLSEALETQSMKDASHTVSAQTGMPRKMLYDMALSLRDS